MTDNADSARPSAAEQMLGDFAPGLVHFTDDVLFGEVWKRPQLSPRDRSLITVAALVAGGNAEQLTFHLQYAKDNGATDDELIEGIGLTQSRGGDVVVLHPGDTVWCPPGEWHWHGAAPDRFMTHLAIWDGLADGQDGPETEWGEHVTDGEYGQTPA